MNTITFNSDIITFILARSLILGGFELRLQQPKAPCRFLIPPKYQPPTALPTLNPYEFSPYAGIDLQEVDSF